MESAYSFIASVAIYFVLGESNGNAADSVSRYGQKNGQMIMFSLLLTTNFERGNVSSNYMGYWHAWLVNNVQSTNISLRPLKDSLLSLQMPRN
jgi:hypothetical protein